MFAKANKEKSKLRLAIFGVSGSGKTKSALRIATGISSQINKRIALIDSERGTASKYSDEFDFDTAILESKKVDSYIKTIQEASKAGYEILIIDSASHAWDSILEEVEIVAQASFKGNTWSAWSKLTPKYNKFIEAIIDYPGHIIITMRSKTEWDRNEKNQPIRVGTSPKSGKDIEYEFDMLMSLSSNHIGEIIKDRSGKFQDKIIENPNEDLGIELINWLSVGVEKPKVKIDYLQKLKDSLPELDLDRIQRKTMPSWNELIESDKITPDEFSEGETLIWRRVGELEKSNPNRI